MTDPIIRFVDAPSLSATVRLDLHDTAGLSLPGAVTAVEGDDFSLGAPELSGEPGAVGRAWGLRALSFTWDVDEDSRTAAQRAVSLLAREQMRPDNWLLVQMPDLPPVWYRLWQSAPSAVSFEQAYAEPGRSRWRVEVELPADPFGYGSRESLGTFALAVDPSLDNGGAVTALPPVKGDAGAPLLLASNWVVEGGSSAFLSTWRVPRGVSLGSRSFAESVGSYISADSSASGTLDSSAANGSYTRVDFTSTAAMADRFTIQPATTLRPGSYRVLARVRTSVGDSKVSLRVGQVPGDESSYQATTPVPIVGAANYWRWVDLGKATFPFRAPALSEAGDYYANSDGGRLVIAASRASGTSTVDLDGLLLVPVSAAEDSRLCAVVGGTPGLDTPNRLLVDSLSEAAMAAVYGGGKYRVVNQDSPVSVRGGFPAAWGDGDNYLLVTRNGSSLTTTTTVEVSYYPQWVGLPWE